MAQQKAFTTLPGGVGLFLVFEVVCLHGLDYLEFRLAFNSDPSSFASLVLGLKG